MYEFLNPVECFCACNYIIVELLYTFDVNITFLESVPKIDLARAHFFSRLLPKNDTLQDYSPVTDIASL